MLKLDYRVVLIFGGIMKIKKWHIILGVVLLSIAASEFNMDSPMPGSLIGVVLILFGELVKGFINLIKFIIRFALSWQGVLLLFVILMYKGWKEYLELKYKNK